ncbi:hypothetical protein DFH06DRAFT_1466733 [Mycena polygramma]|nr:hypothetical protein DFH06DRAFT_1466733 [Mycena polygramma]
MAARRRRSEGAAQGVGSAGDAADTVVATLAVLFASTSPTARTLLSNANSSASTRVAFLGLSYGRPLKVIRRTAISSVYAPALRRPRRWRAYGGRAAEFAYRHSAAAFSRRRTSRRPIIHCCATLIGEICASPTVSILPLPDSRTLSGVCRRSPLCTQSLSRHDFLDNCDQHPNTSSITHRHHLTPSAACGTSARVAVILDG